MNHNVVRLAVGGTVVCFFTWVALAATAGNVGLQRSISKGALTLFELPQVVLVVGLLAFGLAYLAVRLLQLNAARLFVAVLVGDLFAGLVLAPLAVGELEPIHAPLVVASVSLLGLQPAAVAAGAWLANSRSRAPTVTETQTPTRISKAIGGLMLVLGLLIAVGGVVALNSTLSSLLIVAGAVLIVVGLLTMSTSSLRGR